MLSVYFIFYLILCMPFAESKSKKLKSNETLFDPICICQFETDNVIHVEF